MTDRKRPTMQLTEPVTIPEPYHDDCLQFLQAIWQRRAWEMREDWGIHDLPLLTTDDLLRTMMADSLATIARAADGQIERDEDGWNVGLVIETIQSVMELVFSSPVTNAYEIPSVFWETGVGQMTARAQIWARGDELISLAEAAKMRGVTIQAIQGMIDRGALRAYVDPDSAQRQRRRLVSRADIADLDK